MILVNKDAVRAALEELSDPDAQYRLWVDGSGAEMSSFAECLSSIFDDSGLELALERRDAVFGPEIDSDLRELGRLVSRIDGSRSPQDIIEEPFMAQARGLAASIRLRIDGSADA